MEDGKSGAEESIYEEPPSLRETAGARTDGRRRRSRNLSDDGKQAQGRADSRRWSQAPPAGASGGPHHIDLRPNWRQFLLDGAVRGGRDEPAYPLVVQAPPTVIHVPVLAAPPPPLPPLNSGRMPPPPRRPTGHHHHPPRGLHRSHR